MIYISEILAKIKPTVLGWIQSYIETYDLPGKDIDLEDYRSNASWEGGSFSTVGKTLIDLSATFGVPAGIKAVKVWIRVNDAASASGDYYLILSPNSIGSDGLSFSCPRSGNDHLGRYYAEIPCDGNGDIYYQVVASGASTLDVYLRVWGYRL